MEDNNIAELKSPQNVEKEVENLVNKQLLCNYLLTLVENLEDRYNFQENYMMYFFW